MSSWHLADYRHALRRRATFGELALAALATPFAVALLLSLAVLIGCAPD